MAQNAETNEHRLIQATLKRAEILLEMGEFDKALEDLKRAYDLSPELAAESYTRGLFLYGQQKEDNGEIDSAIESFRLAEEIAPGSLLKSEIFQKINDLENPQPPACPNCTREIEQGWKKCPYCGTSLIEDTTLPPASTQSNIIIPFNNLASKIPAWVKLVLLSVLSVTIMGVFFLVFYNYNKGPLSFSIQSSPSNTVKPFAITTESKTITTKIPTATIDKRDTTLTAKSSLKTANALSTSALKTENALKQATKIFATKQVYQATRQAVNATRVTFTSATQASNVLLEAAEKVCNGEGVSEAANYEANREFHPLIVYPVGHPYPVEAKPNKIGELEIVACIEKDSVISGTKRYGTSGNFTCSSRSEIIKIKTCAAQTGNIIQENILYGTSPICGQVESFPSTGLGIGSITKDGDPPDESLIWERVKELVNLELKIKKPILTPTFSVSSNYENLVYENNFKSSNSEGISIKSGLWSVTKEDNKDNNVYQSKDGRDNKWAHIEFGPDDFSMGTVEFHVKLVDFDKSAESGGKVSLQFGRKYWPDAGYTLDINPYYKHFTLAYEGAYPGGTWTRLDQTNQIFTKNVWYSIRLEVSEDKIFAYLNDQLWISTSRSMPSVPGPLMLSVDSKATIQIDDVKVWESAP